MERKVQTSSVSKRKRSRGKGKHVSTEEVGIGKLPVDMLCRILSFLKTKDAVQKRVLSKRWRNAWTSVPCIDIQYPEDGCSIDFIYKLLRLNTVSCLRKFSLTWGRDYEKLGELISVVLKRDIEEIVLTEIWGDQLIQLPPSIFTCKKLVILKIGSDNVLLDVPSFVDLPSLKILHICLRNLSDKDSMVNLLDGCPVIEELDIQGVDYYNVNTTFFVQSSLIKNLSIHLSCYNHSRELRVVVDVPNVERLDLTSQGNVQYDTSSLASLIKLNTSVRQDSGLVELLKKSTNTKHMAISCETITSLECQQFDDFPIFYNLTHLVVKNDEYSRAVLPALLECSPNLVTLESYWDCARRGSREEQQHHFKAPKRMTLYLEKIELKGLKGFMHEMEMISYLLKNSMVLKKLSIQSIYLTAKKHLEITKKLLTFPRSSPDCQIIFDS